MSLTRWQPLQEMMALRDAVDRLFDPNFFQPISLTNGADVLPLDIIEKENDLVVRAAVPGYEPDQIDVSIQGDRLTLRGQVEQENQNEQTTYHLREYTSHSFQRMVRLPVPVNSEAARAECKNGILTLTLPKATESQAKRIKIQNQLEQPETVEG